MGGATSSSGATSVKVCSGAGRIDAVAGAGSERSRPDKGETAACAYSSSQTPGHRHMLTLAPEGKCQKGCGTRRAGPSTQSAPSRPPGGRAGVAGRAARSEEWADVRGARHLPALLPCTAGPPPTFTLRSPKGATLPPGRAQGRMTTVAASAEGGAAAGPAPATKRVDGGGGGGEGVGWGACGATRERRPRLTLLLTRALRATHRHKPSHPHVAARRRRRAPGKRQRCRCRPRRPLRRPQKERCSPAQLPGSQLCPAAEAAPGPRPESDGQPL